MTDQTKPTEIKDADLDVSAGMQIKGASTSGKIELDNGKGYRVDANEINGVRIRGARVNGIRDPGHMTTGVRKNGIRKLGGK